MEINQENQELNYEESIKKEMESIELSNKSNDIINLGSVQTHENKSIDPEILSIKAKTGYTYLDKTLLPSKGKFYREDFKIYIRAAKVAEIRDFSTMDENSLFDVDEKLNEILAQCSRVEYSQNRLGNYKDLLEEDRLYVILSIREITFKSGENKLMLSAKCNGCKKDNNHELKTTNLQYYDSEEFEKYYNDTMKCYCIETKSSGTLNMAPPTIGVMRSITNYIKDKEEAKEDWDKSFFQLVPYLHREWRGLDKKSIFDMNVEFYNWTTVKYSTIFRISEKMKVGIKQNFDIACNHCGAEVTVPVNFRAGVKALFVVSDLSDELL